MRVVIDDDVFDVPKLVSGKTVVERDLNRLQPDFRLTVVSAHINVHRFVAVKAHKEKPVWAFPKSSRHRGAVREIHQEIQRTIYTVPYINDLLGLGWPYLKIRDTRK